MSRTKTDSSETPDQQSMIDDLRGSEVPNHYADALITLGFLVGTAIFLYLSSGLNSATSSKFDPGAAFWPRVSLAVVGVASIINAAFIFRRLWESGSVVPAVDSVSDNIRTATTGISDDQKMFYLAIISVTLYLAALKPMGFIFSTPLFLLAFSWIAGYRKPLKLLVFSVAVTLVLFASFRTVMNIALPYGNGIFREGSIFFEIALNNLLP